MKSLMAVLAALFCAALGVYVLVVAHASTAGLFLGGALVFLALALSIPAQLQPAVAIVVQYLPDALVGGRRKNDPAAPDAKP